MNAALEIFQKVIKSVSDKTGLYLRDKIGVDISATQSSLEKIDTLILRDVTAIMGIGSPISMSVAFSLDRSLAEHLTEIETAGLGIADHERERFILESVAETANLILGDCITDLAKDGQIVTLSPPVVIKDEQQLHRSRDASFASLSFTTNRGVLNVGFITPPHLFDEKVNLLSRKETV